MNMDHMDYLENVADQDIAELKRKEETYKGSWKKRGGVGACMMIVRKIDRLEVILEGYGYDVFEGIRTEPSGTDGSLIAEIRDLRRYLMLVEAEMLAQGILKLDGEG